MYAAALETKSSHPVAAAIVNHFSGCITDKIAQYGAQINLPDVTKFKNESGMGLSGLVDGKQVLVGNLDLMQLYNVEVSNDDKNHLKMWSNLGRTVVFVAVNDKVIVLFLFFKQRAVQSPTPTF
jgi:Cation transport ATPase